MTNTGPSATRSARRLLEALPLSFTIGEARARAPSVGYAPRSAEGAVRRLVRDGLIARVARGQYVKASPPFRVPRAVAPRDVPPGVSNGSPLLLFNRELSWIDFNWRVLAQALDARVPIAERVRFVSITARNLDEFMRTRVGGIYGQVTAGVTRLSPDGRTPAEQVRLLRQALAPMWIVMNQTWADLQPRLTEQTSVRVVSVEALGDGERRALDDTFERTLFPLLTPLAVDKGHRFPFISNQSLSLAVVLRRRGRKRRGEHFARLKVPLGRGRFLPVGDGAVVAVEDLIRRNLAALFPGMKVVGAWAFRVTRSAAIERSGGEDDDLVAMISEELRERQFADPVRLEIDAAMPESVQSLLVRALNLDPADVWPTKGLLDLSGLSALANRASAAPGASFPSHSGAVPPVLSAEASVFDAVRERDVLVYHPYESFRASVQRFIEEAADDPAVLAVKLTLYRTSDDSPIIEALVRAAQAGKQVAVLVEVQARFDEANNIEWARVLEDAGAHVAFGLPGLKTHAKTALVVRDEGDAVRTYVHLGTGNYNPSTARLYTDLGLLSSDETLGRDVAQLFHVLTGYATKARYTQLLVAPDGLRKQFLALIHRETRLGSRGRIVAKMNALEDARIVAALYAAGRAGVEVDLVVRGHCRLRPGLPGISETIRVRSIVGRFLEHDRIYWFGNDGAPKVLTGSADWQKRNLDDRIEAIVPVADDRLREALRAVLWSCLRDDTLAWTLGPDGRYTRLAPGARAHNHQETMMRWAARGGAPRSAQTEAL